MLSEKIQNKIPLMQQYFAGQPVARAWLFGSYSRGEERIDSDVDILIEYKEKAKISLFTISRIACSLQKLLDRSVDLVEVNRVLPFASKNVQQDRILIYERKD